MKLRKLDTHGFAHHFILALIVVGTAIAGTYYLAFSNADSVTYQNGRIALSNSTFELDGSQRVDTLALGPTAAQDLSPNGKEFATLPATPKSADAQQYKLSVASVGESDTSKIKTYDLPLGKQYSDVKWSPDGKWLMMKYRQDTSGSPNVTTYGAWIVQSDGTNGKDALANKPTTTASFAWMPDSNSILYGTYNKDTSKHDLCTIKLDGSNLKCNELQSADIWDLGYSISVSGDGTKVLFRSFDNNTQSMNLYLANLDGTGLKALTSYTSGQQVVTARFSPDKALIAYSINGAKGEKPKIYTVNVDGSNIKELTGLAGAGTNIITGWERLDANSMPKLTMACAINAPASVLSRSTINPVVTVANQGNYASTIAVNRSTSDMNGIVTEFPSNNTGKLLTPGQSMTYTLSRTASDPSGRVVFSVKGEARWYRGNAPYTCSKTVSITALTYTLGCTITNLPSRVSKGAQISPSVTIKNSGNSATGFNLTGVINFNKGINQSLNSSTTAKLQSAASITRGMGKHTIPKNTKATSAVIKVTVQALADGRNSTCSKTISIK